jgi:peptide/nickel transport system permease protein
LIQEYGFEEYTMKKVKEFFRYLLKSKVGMAGFIIVVLTVIITIAAPLIAPYPPESPITSENRMPPSATHLFGTDETGLDIFSRVIYAGQFDLTIGVVSTLLSLLIGVPLGLLIAYFEGFFGEVTMRLMDLLQAFPVFIFAMALVAVLGNKIENIIAAITFLNAPIYLRLVRSEALSYKTRPFIEAAKCTGNNSIRIIFTELLPVSIRPALIQASVNIGSAILLTAGLSFIGAGVRAPTPEWGSMIFLGADSIITGQWWSSFFPGIAIAWTVLGFALFGDFLRKYLNPERR